MGKVAIIKKYKDNVNFREFFDFEYSEFYLCDTNIKKVLKNDISQTFLAEYNKDDFDYVIVVGAEPAKHVANIGSVTKMQGYLCDDKFIPIINPIMLKFKPDMRPLYEKSVRDIKNIINGTVAKKSEITLNLINDEDEAEKVIEDLYQLVALGKLGGTRMNIAVDTETSDLYARSGYLLGLCLAWEEDEGYYINADVISDELIEKLQHIFNYAYAIFHNAKFDRHWLKYHFNLEFGKWHDTMLLHYLLDENSPHGLKELSIKYLDLGDYDSKLDEYKKAYCKQNKVLVRDFSYSMIPFEILGEYGATDPIATIRLFNKFYPIVFKNKKTLNRVYTEILKPGTDFLLAMEDTGVPFDIDTLYESQAELAKSIHELEQSLYHYPEVHELEKQLGTAFNPNSVIQVRKLLYEILRLPKHGKKTATGADSVDAEVLESLSNKHALPALILKIKKEKKIKSTYIDKILVSLDADSRLRTGFHLHTTTSGRLSSSGKLNMQQLPRNDKRPKKAIKAAKGFKIVNIDLGTAEAYVAAALSKDKKMQQIFIDGGDFHSQIAKIKFNLPYTWQEIYKNHKDKRQDAKAVTFSILYKLNLKEEALKGFPTLKIWLKNQIKYIENHGYIYSAFGRKRRLGNAFSSDRSEAAHNVRSGVNFLVQSVSSDVNLLGAIDLHNWIVKNGYEKAMKIFALVHDSILAEVADEVLDLYVNKAREFLQKDRGMYINNTPIKVDAEVGQSYGEVEEWEINNIVKK